ncbi:nicotinamidase-related amidase [Sphingomonas sp. BE123]|uniref:cysteine hydrolase family protein n=1 Tax=Sphingomonas sp. BE123 TaxID=2817842 RepID=UPI0028592DE1|nr:isochorismatase family cysteine hydrolase [Sphingomonas sp. BE123]MDR6851785.1 nicotinamidase-related amidase [Sphingomonas sp. BE123]
MLIIDMINQFDFDDAASARQQLIDVVPRIRALRDAADRAQSPVVYINDNFGEWHSERSRLIARVEDHEEIAPILPRPSDYFVIKPQFSGFYATNLPVLLPKLGVNRLILSGIATEMCVFVTAADAHMRDYRLWVPGDAVVSVCPSHGRAALEIMQHSMGAQIVPSTDQNVSCWFEPASEG